MSISESLISLVGQWQGTNKLWLDPAAPARESDSRLVISLTAQGKFAVFQYTWADEGAAQDGLLFLGSAGPSTQAQAVWVDSWHMQDTMMVCEGSLEPDGSFSVRGAYAVPPGPDWGWRIALEPQAADTIRLSMYNITPDGEEALAVETIYRRAA
jgi:hypothetical protein